MCRNIYCISWIGTNIRNDVGVQSNVGEHLWQMILALMCLLKKLPMKPIYGRVQRDMQNLWRLALRPLYTRSYINVPLTYLWHVGDILYTADIYSFTRHQPPVPVRIGAKSNLDSLQHRTCLQFIFMCLWERTLVLQNGGDALPLLSPLILRCSCGCGRAVL